jgi:hypothetical protein
MNHYLSFLILITAGCATAIVSKFELDRAEVQGKTIRELCQNRPRSAFLEISEPVATAFNFQSETPVISTNSQLEEGEPATEESLIDLAKKNPVLAAQKAEALPAGYGRVTALNQVAAVWVDQDPAAALSWAKQLPDPDDRSAVTSAALFQWGQANPQNAIAYAESCDLGSQSRSTMGILVQKWAASDMSSAITYVSRQPSGEMKDEMISRLAPIIATKYPDLAGQIVSQRMAPGPAQTEAAMSVLYQWALQDPDGATAWAKAFPSGALKERALKEIAGLADYQSQ